MTRDEVICAIRRKLDRRRVLNARERKPWMSPPSTCISLTFTEAEAVLDLLMTAESDALRGQ